MHKERSKKQNEMRGRIAYLAARLIAEDGINDFAAAKKKASMQLGAADTHCLPDNSEIEEALRVFHALYQPKEHAAVLRYLRSMALSLMRLLQRFNPYLTGPVLSGTAGRHSPIDLTIHAESIKDLEFFLIDRRIPYKTGEFRNGKNQAIPVFHLEQDGIIANIAVYSDFNSPPGQNRAKIAQVEEMLAKTGINQEIRV